MDKKGTEGFEKERSIFARVRKVLKKRGAFLRVSGSFSKRIAGLYQSALSACLLYGLHGYCP
jgi:hypothetical protein